LTLPYDLIIVASSWASEIMQQLNNEFCIPVEKIIVVPDEIIKFERPFENENSTLELADIVCKYYLERDCVLFLEGGLLLGLIRDGAPLKWDNDIDFLFKAELLEKFIKVTIELKNYLNLKGVKIKISKSSHKQDVLKIWRIHLMFDNNDGEPLSIELFPAYLSESLRVFGRGWIFSDSLFNQQKYIKYKKFQFLSFYDSSTYLTEIYGNWKIENREHNYWSSHEILYELSHVEVPI
jgi:hypothetical protein